MNTVNELKANDKCQTCQDSEICGASSAELVQPDDMEAISKDGIKALVVVYECKHYKKC